MDLYPTTGPRYYTNQTRNVGVCKKKISCGRKQQELCLTEGWHYLVAGQLRPCRGFDQLRQPDTALTQSNYKSWGPITTALLRKMGGGCFYTNDHSVTTTGNDECPACHQHDGHEHRLFYCQHSAHLRTKRWPNEEWKTIPTYTRLHGLADKPAEWMDYMQFLAVRWTPRLRLPTQTQFYTASPMAVPAIHKTQISAGTLGPQLTGTPIP